MKRLREVVTVGALSVGSLYFHASAQDVLPRPDPPFKGVMRPDARTSSEDWPADVNPPKGAPNILLILVDDVGFSATHTFGGTINTPTFDTLAQKGLKYNEFHVNAICAPSRASLLSGRTDHQVGFGSITEFATGYPGYNSLWPKSAASVAEVLKDNGYNTAAFGKWHDTPVWQATPAGPFDRWPTGLGFEYFYGFLSAFDSQYSPRLYRDTTPVEPQKTTAEGYNLTDDLTNDAIRWLHLQQAASDKPFFLYFATGATHTPHQVPKRWVDPYRGKFDEGWDKLREETFERQKKLGVIPANAEDTPRPKGLPAWDSLPADQRKLLARQAEIYAGLYDAGRLHDIGRLIQEIKDEGKADNTLIILRWPSVDNRRQRRGWPDRLRCAGCVWRAAQGRSTCSDQRLVRQRSVYERRRSSMGVGLHYPTAGNQGGRFASWWYARPDDHGLAGADSTGRWPAQSVHAPRRCSADAV